MIPQIGDYAKKWTTWYKDMLLFMPVYLLLMYMALNVLTTSDFFKNGYVGNLIANPANDTWYSNFLILGVNAAIVIVLLNMPLIVAFKMGGVATTLFSKTGLTAGGVWGKVSGWAGRNTVGKGASWADKKLSNMPLGNSLLARDLRGASLGALAGAKMGGNRSYTEQAKEMKEVTKKAKEIGRSKQLATAIANAKAGRPPVIGASTTDVLGAMSKDEKLKLGFDRLKDIHVLKSLKDDDFEAIKKSDEFTDEQKTEIAKARVDALQDAVGQMDTASIKNMVENMDGKDIMKLIANNPTLALDNNVVEQLKPSQLKTMAEEGLDETTRRRIGDTIHNWETIVGRAHRAASFVNKPSNMNDWQT